MSFLWFSWSPFFEAFVFTLEGHFSTCHAVKRCRVVFWTAILTLSGVSQVVAQMRPATGSTGNMPDMQQTCNRHLTHLDTFVATHCFIVCPCLGEISAKPFTFPTLHKYAINWQTNVSSNLLGTNKNNYDDLARLSQLFTEFLPSLFLWNPPGIRKLAPPLQS